MSVEVKVPVLSESVAEATLLSWHKKEGEHVDRDENLVDIETDKVVLELPAPVAGVLTKINKGDGATVMSGEIIALLDSEAEMAASPAVPPAPAPDTPAAPGTTAPRTPAKVQAAVASPSSPTPPAAAPASAASQPALMPAARGMAAKANLEPDEISSIKGTGRGGRITKEDMAAHMESKHSSSPANAAPEASTASAISAAPAETTSAASGPGAGRPEKRVPMTRLRARIAERLVQSQSTAAILTTFNEVNMQAILDLRARYKDKFEKEHGVKLGLMSFFVKAAVAALKKFPIVNASVDGNDIVYHDYYDIGIAVSSPRGLVVPVIRDADTLSQAGIERKIADFGKPAMDGK
jgi:2-oxoglutarate dehydrogenase E2 component (dihydrolipoamide succinyltransferase)